MPLYDYYCTSCHKTTELLQKVSDPTATECPHCHQPKLKKQVSAAGFQLKGSGWYVTDFKNNKKQKEIESKTSTDTPSETTTPPSTEAKKED